MQYSNKYEPTDNPLDQYYSEIASRTQWDKGNPTPIVFTVGTARVGSTASLNLFRGSTVIDSNDNVNAIPVAYQHFKAGLRHAMLNWNENSEWSFQIPKVPLFYMKDTIGPYTQKESEYNPLKVFEKMGYPKDKLFVNFLYRNPLDVFSSWVDKWGEIIPRDSLLTNFIIASNTLKDIHKDIESSGIPYASMVYESIRDNAPLAVADSLFMQINKAYEGSEGIRIAATENTTENWERLDREGWHPDQPRVYELPHVDSRVHQEARTKTSWSYRNKTTDELTKFLHPDEVIKIESEGIFDIYDYFRDDTQRTLGLSVEGSSSLKDIYEVYTMRNMEGAFYTRRS